MSDVQLQNKHKSLHLPDGGILLYRYEEGDCDTIAWPLRKKQHSQLAGALYAEMMCGEIDEYANVILPNGETFDVIGNLK
jgi:hypothetical protein